jgi:hypothetical protein
MLLSVLRASCSLCYLLNVYNVKCADLKCIVASHIPIGVNQTHDIPIGVNQTRGDLHILYWY